MLDDRQRFVSVLGVVLALLPLLAQRGAFAQTQLAEYTLPGPFGAIGERVGLAGDVDADGVIDLLVAGRVGVGTFSGATGVELDFQPITMVDEFDGVLSVAGLDDCDGDGQPDFAVCTTHEGATAYSRAAGTALWNVPGSPFGGLGWRTDVSADLDGDGLRDLVLGEPDADPAGLSSAGSIHLISGASGATIRRFDGSYAQQSFGRAVASFQDLDLDGEQDVLVGDKAFSQSGTTFGRMLVLSSANGAILRTFSNPVPSFNFAIEVGDAGDLDGDGVHDAAALSVVDGVTSARAWSGDTTLRLWSQPVSEYFVLRSVGDVNGDQAPELVVGTPGAFTQPGTGKLLDGATGAILQVFFGATPGSFIGLAAPGDLSGDGLPDVVVATANGAGGAPAQAQVRSLPDGAIVHTLAHPAGGTGLGRAATFAGDFDADGQSDIVLASSIDICVFSRVSGALLRQIETSPSSTSTFGTLSVAGPGDTNGDGIPDLVLGDTYHPTFTGPQVGRVTLYSGADGTTLHEVTGVAPVQLFGNDVTVTVDRDGDGVNDLLVGSPNVFVSAGGGGGAGKVQLLSGKTLAALDSFFGLGQTSGRFGVSIDAGGDLNGDGVPEMAIGSQEVLAGAPSNSGALHLLDGASGAILMSFGGQLESVRVTGAIVGDADGDELPDLLVAEPFWPQVGANTLRGRIRLVSGADGALLWELSGDPGQFLGEKHAAAGDVNGDGYADVMASRGPSILVLSGLDGATLDTIPLTDAVQAGALLPMGRFDAGACDDVLVAFDAIGGNGGARVFASSAGGLHGFTDLGHAKASAAGELPTLAGYGDLDGGQLLTLRARHLPASSVGSWFISLSAGYVPFKQGVLVPSPFGPFFRLFVMTNPTGEFSLTALNPQAVFLGLTVVHQIWVQDPGASAGACATNGLQKTYK